MRRERNINHRRFINNDKVRRERFEELRDAARAAGGWYSRQWGKVPGGFGFAGETEAVAFAAAIGPTSEPTADAEPATTGGDPYRAAKLREMADGLQPQIDHKTRELFCMKATIWNGRNER